MKVSDIMTTPTLLTTPQSRLSEAAMLMSQHDIGSLPVGDNDRLVGMVTDRDIVVRGLARGLSADSSVREVMSEQLCYCFDDEDVDHVAKNMASLQVRRLPVVNRDKRLVGIVSLADFAHSGEKRPAEQLLKGVAQPHH